jgi:glycosyltransferase involved in cell wall biosynthesis
MKVLVLSQYFWPESFRINEVVESLQRSGCEVTVLTGQPNYPDGRIFAGHRAWKSGKENHSAGYSIIRVPLIPRGNAGAIRLTLNYLSFIFTAAAWGSWLLRGQKFDVVLVYAPSPILQVIPAVWLAWLKQAKLVTWVQDLWPESLSATGFVKSARLLKIIASVVRWIYRKNDLLLVQSEAFMQPVKMMAGRTKVVYHPNPGQSENMQKNVVAHAAYKLMPGFNVVFTGNLGSVQGLDTVLDAAELLKEYEDVKFVLIGSGSRSEWLQQEVMHRGLTNVKLPGRFKTESMPSIMAQASALLVSFTRHPILAMTVPSKVQPYLAAGRPLIASLDGEGARVVREARAGLVCPADDAAALAQAVLQLRTTSCEERERMGRAGQKYYLENYDPVVLANRLVATLREIVWRTKA